MQFNLGLNPWKKFDVLQGIYGYLRSGVKATALYFALYVIFIHAICSFHLAFMRLLSTADCFFPHRKQWKLLLLLLKLGPDSQSLYIC